MQHINLKRGNKVEVNIENPEIHITGVNVLINGEHKHYNMDKRLERNYGPAEKVKRVQMVVHADDKKEYYFDSYIAYGRITEEDSNNYLYVLYLRDENKIVDNFEIEIQNKE